MSDYIPGRVYSGVVNGTRRLLFCGEDDQTEFSWVNDHGMLRFSPKNGVIPTDVRGPLVVLDANYYADCNWHDIAVHLRNGGYGDLADQIEAQTTPPLQVGWHECHLDNALPRVFWWDGERFLHAPHGSWVDRWRSVAYLGRGTCA